MDRTGALPEAFSERKHYKYTKKQAKIQTVPCIQIAVIPGYIAAEI
jgi:hypothetical protein